MRALRVLHCPTLTAGHGGALAAAERRIGLNSFSVATTQNYLGYKVDSVLRGSTSLWAQQLALCGLLLKAALHYDVVHYNAGSSILPHRFSSKHAQRGTVKWLLYRIYCAAAKTSETALLRQKVIAVTFQGDDARQGDFCLSRYDTSIAGYDKEEYYTKEKDTAARSRIGYFDRHADLIYAQNPDLLHVLPNRAKFLPYCCSLCNGETETIHLRSKAPIVVHAPTNRQAKGTEFIISAVNRLKEQGIKFEFKLVEGLSHSQAINIYKQADLVVDQLLVGWYGNFATEVMALGKPVICYIREEDLKFVPTLMAEQLPLINARPASIYFVLKDWLSARKNDLPRQGTLSRQFVERWHDPEIIARDVASDYLSAFYAKATGSSRPF
jgi:hypothetical protein